jgi:hypothetical protein
MQKIKIKDIEENTNAVFLKTQKVKAIREDGTNLEWVKSSIVKT